MKANLFFTGVIIYMLIYEKKILFLHHSCLVFSSYMSGNMNFSFSMCNQKKFICICKSRYGYKHKYRYTK